MSDETPKKTAKWKIVLAVIGAGYLVVGVAWAGYALWQQSKVKHQPNLAAMSPAEREQVEFDREFEKLNDKLGLGLTAEQKVKAQAILKEAGVLNAPPLQAIQGLAAARQKLREILTPEQQQKMDATEKERTSQRADRMIDRLKKQVGISETQEMTIRNILEESSPMQAGGNNSQPMFMRFMQSRDRIRKVLTPEQQEKFDKMPGAGGILKRLGLGGQQNQSQEDQ